MSKQRWQHAVSIPAYGRPAVHLARRRVTPEDGHLQAVRAGIASGLRKAALPAGYQIPEFADPESIIGFARELLALKITERFGACLRAPQAPGGRSSQGPNPWFEPLPAVVSLPPVVAFAFADTDRSLTPRLPARLALFLNFIAASYGEVAIASDVPRRMRLENHNRHRLGAAICPKRDGRRRASLDRGRGV